MTIRTSLCIFIYAICVQALLTANTNANDQFNTILDCVGRGGVVFIGTPHSGVNSAGISAEAFIKILVGAVYKLDVDVRHDLVEELAPSSKHLFDLTDDFRQLIAARRINIATLLEGKKTRLRGFPDLLVRNLSNNLKKSVNDLCLQTL